MHKNKTIFTAAFAVLFFTGPFLHSQETDKYPPRLRRSESFLGIHFDFHAGPDCKEVGKNTTPEMLAGILDKVKPDYVQTDCKGHAGYTSYPTKVGNPVPGFVGDPLKIWRHETAKRGIGLYMHYSGVWDARAIELRPEWAAINADGNRNSNNTSVFGPYVDLLLIPQLKELANDYQIDGVWVDGECWATVPDYGERAVQIFRETTGFDTIPKGPGDPLWFEWLQFHREGFRKYFRHYVAEVHKEYPQFQICSNWAFTDHMPEPVSVATDFLSGDYSPNNSVNSARDAGRYLVHQGIPWDLMAWSFSMNPRHQKTAVQLKREAAIVLALGGGFQAYFTQNRDGSVRLAEMEVMAEVAKFARERQPYCHHSIPIPQVALLYSTAAAHRENNGLFPRGPGGQRLKGVLQCLLEGQNSVDIVGEHTLGRDMNRFPVIVVPEWNHLPEIQRTDLVEYAKNGGALFIIGENTVNLFKELLPAESMENKETPGIIDFGNGKVAMFSRSIGAEYAGNDNEDIRKIVNETIRKIFPEPAVEVSGSRFIDVTLSRLNDKTILHLVNTSGDHRGTPIIEKIEPVGPLQVVFRLPEKPAKITLQPEGKNCDFEYRAGKAFLTVDSVPIYSILVVE